MVHDFTLVYALNPELDSQDEILRRLAGNDCADAMVGWGRPGMSRWPSAGRHWATMLQSQLAAAQMAQVLPGAELVRVDIG